MPASRAIRRLASASSSIDHSAAARIWTRTLVTRPGPRSSSPPLTVTASSERLLRSRLTALPGSRVVRPNVEAMIAAVEPSDAIASTSP